MNPAAQPFNLTDFHKPEDLLNLIKHERVRWLIATIALDGVRLPGDPRPDWAIHAALISRLPMPKSLEMEPALLAVASPENLTSLLHTEYAKAPASDAADFYAGFADGLKRGQLSPRSPYAIYLIFAAAWPELSKLKNVTELHAWIETNLGANMTGTRDRIAKICQKIRMPPN
jgi:hypothetical protein